MNMKYLTSAFIILVVVFFAGRYTTPTPQPETIKEVIETVDTTMVDSLEQEVTHWKELSESERDTVINRIEVPVPTVNDGTNVYNVPYSDSTLSANIGLTIEGVLEEIEFEYYLKRTFVTDRQTTIRELRTITRTTTKYIPRPTDTFQHKLEVGYMLHHDFLQSPYVEYQPSFNIFGVELVGTVHFSQYPHAKIGTRINLN